MPPNMPQSMSQNWLQKRADAPRPQIHACRIRPRTVPAFWRAVDARLPAPAVGLFAQWELVLLALHFPYLVEQTPQRRASRRLRASASGAERRHLYVPILYALWAQRELEAFAREQPRSAHKAPQGRHNAHWVLFALLGLIVWHGLRMGWWSAPSGALHAVASFLGLGGLSPEQILDKGSLHVYQVWKRGEWFRTVTALTLHADSRHLFGNILFGAVFGILLFRRVGFGVGLFLCVGAGMLGNALNVLYRPLEFVSLGFSTAVFGMLGALSGVLAEPLMHAVSEKSAGDVVRRIFLPLAAGVGMLAALGTEGASTDYAAHLLGFASGFGLGGLWQAVQQRFRLGVRWEYALGFSAGTLVLASWFWALQ